MPTSEDDFVRRLIANNDRLKTVNEEIMRNEMLSRKELQSSMQSLRDTRTELEKTLGSYEELKTYKSKLEASLVSVRSEHASTVSEMGRLREIVNEKSRTLDGQSAQISELMTEMDTLRGTCKSLKREKEVLMATYCRVMKENENLREGPVTTTTTTSKEDQIKLHKENESLRSRCQELEVI